MKQGDEKIGREHGERKELSKINEAAVVKAVVTGVGNGN